MLKNLLATTALSFALAGGAAWAQDAPEAEEELQQAEESLDQAQEEVESAQEEVTDPAQEDPMTAQETTEPAAEPADPMTAQEDPAADPMAPDATTTAGAVDPGAEMEMTPIDISELTVEELIGSQLQNRNNESLGTIDNALLNDSGEISSLVVSFGGFLGFGENTVELSLEEVEFMSDGADNVYVVTDLQPEDLEGRPEVEVE
jgi:hypothetical protein